MARRAPNSNSLPRVSVGLIVAIAVVALVALWVALTYNRLVQLRLACESSWSQIDVALRLRHDLVPRLAEAVAGYAGHERTTLEQVARARTQAVAANDEPPGPRGSAEAELGSAVGRAVVLAEDYPELRATENFSQLQRELAEVEEKISITRRVYNDTVETYNTKIQVFPPVIVARAFGFGRREFFDAPVEAETAPEVSVGGELVSSTVKRVVIRLVILAIVGGILYGLSQVTFSSAPKHFRIENADVRVEVQPDASLHVTEQLEYHFTGDFSGAYRDIPLAAGVTARNVSVSEDGEQYRPGGNTALGSYDLPGTFGAEQRQFPDEDGGPTAGFRIVWHYSALDEERTFQVEYDVAGAAGAYGDVVDVPWAVWGGGDQWEFWLDDLDAEIVLADGAAEPVEAWFRPRELGDPEVGPGSASVEATRVDPAEQAVLRAVFPRDAFSSVTGAAARPGPGLETVQAEEAEVDDDESLSDKFAAFVGDNIVLLEVIWTLLVVGAAMALYMRARESRSPVAGGYLSEPPEDIPPALAYAIAEEGAFDDRLVLATLLDLVDRGYYDGRASAGDDLDLRLEIPVERPDEEALTEYERDTMKFFDGLLEEGPGDLGKLKDRVPKHSSSWRTKWENLRDSVDQAEEGQIGWDRDLTSTRTLLALVAVAGYAVIGLAYWNRTHLVAIPIFATLAGLLFIYLYPSAYLKRLDKASRDRHAAWNAFERWTDDFPRLADDPPATLKLWRRILVYAVAFGTAEKVIASGRIPEDVMREATTSGVWLVPHLGGVHSGVTPSFEGFASSFSSQVAPQSSSGGGGGGFSGGGGGFSGGGGGGAW